MFKKALSTNLLRILGERDMTIEKFSDISALTREFISNIISKKQTPTINTLEKICSALEVTPNELLLSDKSKSIDKSKPMRVTHILCRERGVPTEYYPVCPNCNVTLETDYQAYCDRCGQHLSWKNYSKANIIYLD